MKRYGTLIVRGSVTSKHRLEAGVSYLSKFTLGLAHCCTIPQILIILFGNNCKNQKFKQNDSSLFYPKKCENQTGFKQLRLPVNSAQLTGIRRIVDVHSNHTARRRHSTIQPISQKLCWLANSTTRIILLDTHSTWLFTQWNPLQKSFTFEWSNMIDIYSQLDSANSVPCGSWFIRHKLNPHGVPYHTHIKELI